MKTLVSLTLAAVVALGATPAFAAGGQNLDAQTVSLAYGDLMVFILNVAAGNDGTTYNAPAEDAVRHDLAQPIAAAYATLSPDDQQSLGQLAVFDAQLRTVWSSLPDAQRGALRDQWAAQIQPMAMNLSCADFDSMARARLLPSFGQYKDPNVQHLRDCWRQHPELASADERGPSSSGSSGDHGTFVAMMNANMMNYAANMNIASNIGGGEWSYTVK
jgi:hypothetical protein